MVRCTRPPNREVFFDGFEEPPLSPVWEASLPDAPPRFGGPIAMYLGSSGYTFESLDGASVLRLRNVLDNLQRRGWSSSTVFAPDGPFTVEARFNTMVQSPSTAIDELLELWTLDGEDPTRYDIVALSAISYGYGRIFTSHSSVTGIGLDTGFFFADNSWYRMVITGSPGQEVRASIYDDARTQELIGVSLGHTLAAYPAGLRIGMSQSMGQPDAPFPTDSAVDWVRVSYGPPATVVVEACDSRVPNPVLPSGCAISDLVDECAAAGAESDACLLDLVYDLHTAGAISLWQLLALNRCIMLSGVPLK